MLCSAPHASLGPRTLCALIKEGRPWNSSAVTDKCPALVTCHCCGFSSLWCSPTIPRHIPEATTSQEIFPQGSFSITTLFWGNKQVQLLRNRWCCSKLTPGRKMCPYQFAKHAQELYQAQIFRHPLHPFSDLDRFVIFQAIFWHISVDLLHS